MTETTDSTQIELKNNHNHINSNIQDTKIFTARGTEDGLVFRIDGKADWKDIITDVEAFLGGKKKFFEGGQVSIEWLDKLPSLEQTKELEDILEKEYGIAVSVKRRKPEQLTLASNISGAELARNANKKSGVTIKLFQEAEPVVAKEEPVNSLESNASKQFQEYLEEDYPDFSLSPLSENIQVKNISNNEQEGSSLSVGSSKAYVSRAARILGDDLFYDEEANAKIFFGTLRSGQKLETPFSLIVIGDVNPGADLIAGGDIIVFGNLRGTAHASAYDDDSFDRVIISLQMQPVQLRIGSVISRGNDVVVKGAEIARIENRRIIVEAFNPKSQLGRKGK
ncbi:MAG: hypothetical protein KBC84_08825 [Proteobacteria bacterium]|nr:hypothetical protein [Pseudomonadota bacterium]